MWSSQKAVQMILKCTVRKTAMKVAFLYELIILRLLFTIRLVFITQQERGAPGIRAIHARCVFQSSKITVALSGCADVEIRVHMATAS
jgi:hypothetical protein